MTGRDFYIWRDVAGSGSNFFDSVFTAGVFVAANAR